MRACRSWPWGSAILISIDSRARIDVTSASPIMRFFSVRPPGRAGLIGWMESVAEARDADDSIAQLLDDARVEVERGAEILDRREAFSAVAELDDLGAAASSMPGSCVSVSDGAALTSIRPASCAPGRSGRPTPTSRARAGCSRARRRARSRSASRRRAPSIAVSSGEPTAPHTPVLGPIANDVAAPPAQPRMISSPPAAPPLLAMAAPSPQAQSPTRSRRAATTAAAGTQPRVDRRPRAEAHRDQRQPHPGSRCIPWRVRRRQP